MAAMTWSQYLQFLMEVEKENVEENYRIGRGANDADEAMNGDTRTGFANLQAMMPTLLAAQELLTALRSIRDALEELDAGWRGMDATRVDELIAGRLHIADAAIGTAEGRDE